MNLKRFTPGLALLVGIVLSVACLGQDAFETMRRSTVRISAPGSLGTGTAVSQTSESLYLLTNQHVAGNAGDSVEIEFFFEGSESRKIPAKVVYAVNGQDYEIDVAVLKVELAELGDYRPTIARLAPPDFEEYVGPIYSVGHPAGNWPTAFEGRIEENDDKTFTFTPRPASGRSGSGVFQIHDGEPIYIGMVGWRSFTVDPNNGQFDGFGSGSGWGKATKLSAILAAIRGEEVSSRPFVCLGDCEPCPAWPGNELTDDEESRQLLKKRRRPGVIMPTPEPEPVPDEEPDADVESLPKDWPFLNLPKRKSEDELSETVDETVTQANRFLVRARDFCIDHKSQAATGGVGFLFGFLIGFYSSRQNAKAKQ